MRPAPARQLRALGLPLAAITDVAAGHRDLADAVAEHLAATWTRIAELRWREAALRALDDGSDPERLRRLRLPARIQHLPTATADFARAWERVLPASVPRRLAAAILDQAVPEPPGAPTPATVLASAELHALVAEPQFLAYWAAPHVRDKASLYAALLDASEGAAPAVAAGRAPHDCAALRAFTAACARARGTDDTPGSRARMAAEFRGTVPLFRRYRQHVRTVTAATGPSPGTTHCWLVEPSSRSTAPGPDARPVPDPRTGRGPLSRSARASRSASACPP